MDRNTNSGLSRKPRSSTKRKDENSAKEKSGNKDENSAKEKSGNKGENSAKEKSGNKDENSTKEKSGNKGENSTKGRRKIATSSSPKKTERNFPTKENTKGRDNRDRSARTKSEKEPQDSRRSFRSVFGRCDRNSISMDGKILPDNERYSNVNRKSNHSPIFEPSNFSDYKSRDEPHKRVKSHVEHRRSYRDGVGENEISKRSEYQLYRNLSSAHIFFQRGKWDVQKWGSKPTGTYRGEEDHYSFWRNAYDSYLWEIFDRVAGRINKFKNFSRVEIDFDDFVEFAYEFSSGYITPYT